MTQNTPGPWTFGYWGDDFWVGPDSSGQGRKVARVLWDFGNIVEGRKNACLIASAPEMLEALKAVVAAADAYTKEMTEAAIQNGWVKTKDSIVINPDPVVFACRAVIAKAEGHA